MHDADGGGCYILVVVSLSCMIDVYAGDSGSHGLVGIRVKVVATAVIYLHHAFTLDSR